MAWPRWVKIIICFLFEKVFKKHRSRASLSFDGSKFKSHSESCISNNHSHHMYYEGTKNYSVAMSLTNNNSDNNSDDNNNEYYEGANNNSGAMSLANNNIGVISLANNNSGAMSLNGNSSVTRNRYNADANVMNNSGQFHGDGNGSVFNGSFSP